MKMLMRTSRMPVIVFVNQVDFFQKVNIFQQFLGGLIRGNGVVLVKQDRPVRNFLNHLKVMRGGYQRFPGFVQLDQKRDKPPLRSGVKSVQRFVKNKDLGVHCQHAGNGDLLFFAAA